MQPVLGAAAPPAPRDARRKRQVTFAVLAVSVSSFALLQSLIVPVLATIQGQYGTDQATVTWVLTGYLLSASIATPILGRVGDAVGKKKVLVATLALLALGSLLAALAPTIGWLIAARVVQGLGGGVLPLSFGIIRDEFDDQVTGALSVIAALTDVGLGFGFVVAGLVQAVGRPHLPHDHARARGAELDGEHAGEVARERQREHLREDLVLLLDLLQAGDVREVAWAVHRYARAGVGFEAPLELPHAVEVLLEADLVRRAQPRAQGVRLAAHRVEHARPR